MPNVLSGLKTGLLCLAVTGLSACASNQMDPYGPYGPQGPMAMNQGPIVNNPHTVPMYQFQQWVDYEPEYRLYPGDQLDIVVHSAPELSRTLTVGPDGRIVMPMANPVMAAGRTMTQLEAELEAELATQLRDPELDVTPRAYGAQRIFVGGEVGQQGTFELPGPIGAMEAVMMAGGFLPSSKRREVVILRRAPNGGLMMRVVDLNRGMRDPYYFTDTIQLRRHDVVFVPRSEIAEVNLFVQQYFRDVLPIPVSASYNLGDGFTTN